MHVVREDATGQLHLCGTREELHALAASLRSPFGVRPLDDTIPPVPYDRTLSTLEWARTSGPLRLAVSVDLKRVQIRGGPVELGRLAEEIEEHAQEADPEYHRHIEYLPGHAYLADGSAPMVVWIVSPPDAEAAPQPTTLAGMFVLTLAWDGPDLPVYRILLSQTGWHDATSVFITAVFEVVNLRWPGDYDHAEIDEAARQAAAMAKGPDQVDVTTLGIVIRQALGESVEHTSDARTQVGHRLFVIWAFVRQMGLDAATIAATVIRAEQRAIDAGRSPTLIADVA